MYKKNVNIIEYLSNNSSLSQEEIITISYDLQSGSYIKYYESDKESGLKYVNEIIKIISSIEYSSILEVGIGDSTTLTNVILYSDLQNIKKIYGFDCSLSRVLYAKQYMKRNNILNFELCVASLLNMPYQDSSIDLVYTSHSIEPNGGMEKEILSELYRVANKYLILSNVKAKSFLRFFVVISMAKLDLDITI